jgi:hypothetical protein
MAPDATKIKEYQASKNKPQEEVVEEKAVAEEVN